MTDKKTCFVICPIGDAGSDVRRRSDGILECLIKPALQDEFECYRANEKPLPDSITDEVITNLIESDLVIADLTTFNPNVLYELGIRHAINKPFVQIVEEHELSRLPFDLKDVGTFGFVADPLGLSAARAELEQAVEEVMGRKVPRSPVKAVVDVLEALRGGDSGDSAQSSLILREIVGLKRALAAESGTDQHERREHRLLDQVAFEILRSRRVEITRAVEKQVGTSELAFGITLMSVGPELTADNDDGATATLMSGAFIRSAIDSNVQGWSDQLVQEAIQRLAASWTSRDRGGARF